MNIMAYVIVLKAPFVKKKQKKKKQSNLNENKMIITFESFDELNVEIKCQNDELNIWEHKMVKCKL